MYQIIFRPESRTVRFSGTRGNYYEFPDGSHLDVYAAPVWCRPCGGITHGEAINTIGQIDRQIADLRDPTSDLYKLCAYDVLDERKDWGENFRRDQMEQLHRRRAWRLTRVSPPKCLWCGSTNIVLLPPDEQVPHPAGTGTIEVSVSGMCSTSFNEWYFTPEGDRIPRDTKPTYWHHPALDDDPRVQRILRRIWRRGHRRSRGDTT